MAVADESGFAAETITLQPGSTARDINFNWYSDRADGAVSLVQIAKKADLVGGNFPDDKTITVTGIVGDASTGKSYHKASVTGLAPSTEYVYRVSNDGTTYSKTYTFTTGGIGDFQFIAVGDPQLTTGNQDSDSIHPADRTSTTRAGWANTLSVISQYFPDASFMAGTGDQVDTSNSEIQYTYYFEPEYMSSLPVAPSVGNHEGTAANFGYHYNVPNETPGSYFGNYWYTYNNALFVVLNTSPSPNAGTIGNYIPTMDATLQAATEANPGYTWLFVQHHKSTASPASHQTDADILVWSPAFNALMDKYNVDFVLAGHDHVYSRSWFIENGAKVEDIDYSVNTVSDPQGTLYFTMTTGSGLKYYDFLTSAPANPAWVSSTEGLYYEAATPIGTLTGKPWYTNVGIQYKVPQFTVIDVTADSVTFNTYRVDTMESIDIYTVVKSVPAVVTLNGDTAVVVGSDVTYTVSVSNVNRLATVTLQFEVDGNYFNGKSFTGLNGFDVLGGGVTWTPAANDMWIGRVTLVNLNGDVSSTGALDIFKMVLSSSSNLLGTTNVKLLDAVLSGYDAADVAIYIDASVTNAVVQTTIGQYFSVYDVNRDGVVDQLDLTTAQLYYMAEEGDANWNVAKFADVNRDGRVDIEDLISILNNIVW
ncbi:MAG: fibronectin type III domain-containing protein [Nitrososphaerota archaeon]|nr:fibronectin type III domain-containing protein [Nitrososphaerota archaeon]